MFMKSNKSSQFAIAFIDFKLRLCKSYGLIAICVFCRVTY